MALRRSVKKAGCDDEYECTCDGGPYLHGPAGRTLVLAQIAIRKNAKPKGAKK
jgi:hypothetical protein